MQYRAEIDGLRTLAVLPVVIYHLKIPFGDSVVLQGGFLGVDIFFVISGYLITRIILEEINTTGDFSITGFYARRARRILPALILVSLTALAASYAIMTPSEIERLAYSILAALGFVGNFFWFSAMSEYGAADAMVQPMLHTWSLAIEEQFYLLFPLLLLFLKPGTKPGSTSPRLVFAIVLALLVASLVASQLTSAYFKPFSFYSPISRAWELLVGSALAVGAVHFAKPEASPPGWTRWLPKVALVVLAASMLFINLKDWSHPGLITLPTVLATAALIWWARPGELVTTILSSAPFTFIGKLSYSIYLWHFPIYALGRLSNPENPTPWDMAIWLVLTAVLSVTGYYLAERPLRYVKSARAFWTPVALGLAAVIGVIAMDQTLGTLSQARGDHLAARYQSDDYDNGREEDRSWSRLNAINGYNHRHASQPSEVEKSTLTFSNGTAPKLLVAGNSHGKDFFNAMAFAAEKDGGFEVARFSMSSPLTEKHINMLRAAPDFGKADVVIIATRYTDRTVDRLAYFIDVLQSLGKTAVVVGNTPEFDTPGSVPLFDYLVRTKGPQRAREQIASDAYRYEKRSEIQKRDARVRAIARDMGVVYLSRRDLICSDRAKKCQISTPEGKKALYDYGHWTQAGAQMIADRMLERNWLEPVLQRGQSAR